MPRAPYSRKQPGRRMHVRTYMPGNPSDMYERESTARHDTARDAGSRGLC